MAPVPLPAVSALALEATRFSGGRVGFKASLIDGRLPRSLGASAERERFGDAPPLGMGREAGGRARSGWQETELKAERRPSCATFAMDPAPGAPAPEVPKAKAKAKVKAKSKAKAKPRPKAPASSSADAKKPSPPTEKGEARSDGTSRVVEAIQRDARLRVAVQRHVYALQCKLLETVDADYLDWTVRVDLCSKLLLLL